MFSNGKTKAFSKAKRALGEEPRAETFEHNKDTDLGGGVVVGGRGGEGMVPGFTAGSTFGLMSCSREFGGIQKKKKRPTGGSFI